MTERFTVDDDDADIWEDDYFLAVAHNHANAKKIAKKLNKLADGNRQLKKQREELFIRERDTKNEWRTLKKENEELKKEVKQLKNKIKTYNSTHELLKETIDRLRNNG